MPPDITSVFKAQQAHQYLLRTTGAGERIHKLKKLKQLIGEHEQQIYAALQQDLRKSEFESAVTEVIFICGEIDFTIRHLKKWMRPVKAGRTMSNPFSKNRIYYEPRGVCLIISPWNYPFQLMMSPLISAIAAGNCAMLKPSELSPATSAVLAQIVRACFEPREVCCFQGDAALAENLLKLPFDHIFFTGSTAVGKIVMAAAAKHLSTLTLELGGKSPVIIDRSANLRSAAEKIAWGKLINAGQTCIAPDYVLIPDDLQQEFIDHYRSAAHRFFFKEGTVPDTQSYAKIINERHFKRLSALIADATDKGAKEIAGALRDPESLTIGPCVFTNVSNDADLMKEEIFGPILPVVTCQSNEHAIAYINNKSKPLALYIFSEDEQAVKQIIRQTSAGGTCVNDVLVHISNPKLPFGGAGASGMGSCHGFYGFKAFSHERSILFQSGINTTRMIYPPYEHKSWVLTLLRRLM